MAQHAILSASASHRWLACTPSARLEERFPNVTSSYAEEGTTAHALCEYILRAQMDKSNAKSKLEKITNSEYYDKDMQSFCEGYADFVKSEYQLSKQSDKYANLVIEEKLDFSEYVPEGFGTGDAVIVGDGLLKIIDFKYGKGVAVSAENNTQMMLYALGAYLQYSIAYDINEVLMVIYQPRLDNISEFKMSVSNLMKWADTELKEKAALAYDGAGEYKAGEHCKFCRAKAVCRARAEYHLNLQKYNYGNVEILNSKEIADILKIAESLVNWAGDIKAYALESVLKNDMRYEGWKVVEGKSSRKYKNEEEVEKVLRSKGYKVKDIFTKKLLGISAMEKLLTKKGFNYMLGNLIEKPTGKPTLVPSTDKRPEFNTAELDFKDIKIN